MTKEVDGALQGPQHYHDNWLEKYVIKNHSSWESGTLLEKFTWSFL